MTEFVAGKLESTNRGCCMSVEGAVVETSTTCESVAPDLDWGRGGEFAEQALRPLNAKPMPWLGPIFYATQEVRNLGAGLRRYDREKFKLPNLKVAIWRGVPAKNA